jgi:hypothetical protein
MSVCIKSVRRVSYVLACAVFFVGGLAVGHRSTSSKCAERDAVIANREVVLVHYGTLSLLRKHGDTAAVFQGLEQVLDQSIMGMWQHRAALTEPERLELRTLFGRIEKYREEHPRPLDHRAGLREIQKTVDALLSRAGVTQESALKNHE